jgi:PKD domain
MLALGMSHANREFAGQFDYVDNAFMARANGQFPPDHPDKAKSDSIVLASGASASFTAREWADPTNECWDYATTQITDAGLTPSQVQVIWMEHAVKGPSGEFEESAHLLQGYLTDIAQNILVKFPNCQIAFLSTRTHAYTTTLRQNPEPYAYEGGFANKWTIQAQIDGDPNLCFNDPNNPDSCPAGVKAPYLCWSSYHWIDGLTPRSDLKTWDCSDVGHDWSHPSGCGVYKVASQLLAFFETNPIATPWYLRKNARNVTITCSANFSVCSDSPYTVQFCADVSGGNGLLRYSWDFDDGDFDYDDPTPTKSFPGSGTYNVHLTVVDADGNHGQNTITIQVPPP